MERKFYKSPTSETYLACKISSNWIEYYRIDNDYLEVTYGRIFNFPENKDNLLYGLIETNKEEWHDALHYLYTELLDFENDY
jgi:hypothetical protein